MEGNVIKYLLCNVVNGIEFLDVRLWFFGIVIMNVDLCKCMLVKLIVGLIVIC